jgi:urease accessory protein
MLNLTVQQLIALHQLTDSMFPSGAFVHSEGLETYVQAGTIQTPADLEAYLQGRLLRGLALSDWVATHSAMDCYQQQNLSELIALDNRLSAMKVAAEGREASVRIGRQTLRTILNTWSDSFLHDYQTAIRQQAAAGHQALVFGLVCAAQGIAKRPTLATYGYSFVSSQVSASIKLMRLGQTHAQNIIHTLQPSIETAVEIALTQTVETMQSFTPALDIRMMQHQYLFRRLFNS